MTKKKFLIILIMVLSTVLILCTPSYSNAISLDDVIDAGDSFLKDSASDTLAGTPKEGDLQNISNTVSGVLLSVAVAVTFISTAIMAINFMIQSVEDKAKIKEAMVPWIIGIIISFGAYGIWSMTMKIFYNL